jgi:hypothetical protein
MKMKTVVSAEILVLVCSNSAHCIRENRNLNKVSKFVNNKDLTGWLYSLPFLGM